MALLKDEQAHPITLLKYLLGKYGPEALEWHPNVLRTTLERDSGSSVAKINLAKMMAAGAVANRDRFWKDWEVFHFICQALNNNRPVSGQLQQHTVGQMMVAVDIANQIRKELGHLSEVPQFSEEVAKYIAVHALDQSIWYLPEPLDFANKYSSGSEQRCRDCGNEEERQEDGLCSFCVDRYNTDSLERWTPDPKLVARGFGKNVELFEKHPVGRVEKRLREALASPNKILRENQVDICVSRLLVALEYLGLRRSQLRDQQGLAA